jgi:hypothetical protein
MEFKRQKVRLGREGTFLPAVPSRGLRKRVTLQHDQQCMPIARMHVRLHPGSVRVQRQTTLTRQVTPGHKNNSESKAISKLSLRPPVHDALLISVAERF